MSRNHHHKTHILTDIPSNISSVLRPYKTTEPQSQIFKINSQVYFGLVSWSVTLRMNTASSGGGDFISPSSNIYEEAIASREPLWLNDNADILVGYLKQNENLTVILCRFYQKIFILNARREYGIQFKIQSDQRTAKRPTNLKYQATCNHMIQVVLKFRMTARRTTSVSYIVLYTEIYIAPLMA